MEIPDILEQCKGDSQDISPISRSNLNNNGKMKNKRSFMGNEHRLFTKQRRKPFLKVELN